MTEVAAFVGRHPGSIALLGARPTEAETEYGWIEPADPVALTTAGPICGVRRFWEKPLDTTARACFDRGCLWNTLVLVAKASTLLESGRQLIPNLHDRLAPIAPFAGTPDEARAIQPAYALAPKVNFSRAVSEPCSPLPCRVPAAAPHLERPGHARTGALDHPEGRDLAPVAEGGRASRLRTEPALMFTRRPALVDAPSISGSTRVGWVGSGSSRRTSRGSSCGAIASTRSRKPSTWIELKDTGRQIRLGGPGPGGK